MKVIFAPEVENNLLELVEILIRKGYLGTYDFAILYVEDLIQFIQTNIHTQLKKQQSCYCSSPIKHETLKLILTPSFI